SICSWPGVCGKEQRHIHFRVSSACAVPVTRNSAAILVRNSLVLIGKFLFPFFVAHFAAEFTVEPALVLLALGDHAGLGASKIQRAVAEIVRVFSVALFRDSPHRRKDPPTWSAPVESLNFNESPAAVIIASRVRVRGPCCQEQRSDTGGDMANDHCCVSIGYWEHGLPR